MSVCAGWAVTFGIRALGCVVNLGKVIRERYYTYMRARICDYFDLSKLVFKAIYIYTISIVKDEVALH